MNTPTPMLRKRGRRTPPAPDGYLRYVEAAKLFAPLDISSFAYRARSGDIDSIEANGVKAYNKESIIKVRNAILLETAAKNRDVSTTTTQQEETKTLESRMAMLEDRHAKLEAEVKKLRGRVASLEAQIP